MSTPRKHHFVPQFYLGGFTPSGSKDDQLYVLDLATCHHWRSSPGDTACQKDFYVLEVSGEGDPRALEKLFSEFETAGAEAIRFVVDRERVPDGKLLDKLIDFLAIMSIRVPAVIDAIEKPLAQVSKSILWQVTASKDRWEALVILHYDRH